MNINKIKEQETFHNAVLTNNLSHFYGSGENRKKVLDGVNIFI